MELRLNLLSLDTLCVFDEAGNPLEFTAMNELVTSGDTVKPQRQCQW
jgi:hypothetical protein